MDQARTALAKHAVSGLARCSRCGRQGRDFPVTHDSAEDSIYFWAHLEDWVEDSEAAGIVKLVRDDDGAEAFRQLNNSSRIRNG